MIAQWYVEAGKYNVLPIDGSAAARLMVERPQVAAPRDRYVYRPGTQTVPVWVAARVLNRPHSITADAEIPAGGAEGVLLCQGSGVGGWTMYLLDGVLHYAHNYVRRSVYRVSSGQPVPEGRHELRFEFEPTGKPDFAARYGRPGPGPAVHRRATGRAGGVPGDHAHRPEPGRADLRRRTQDPPSPRTTARHSASPAHSIALPSTSQATSLPTVPASGGWP